MIGSNRDGDWGRYILQRGVCGEKEKADIENGF